MTKEKRELVKKALREAYGLAGKGNGKVAVQRRTAIVAVAKALGVRF